MKNFVLDKLQNNNVEMISQKVSQVVVNTVYNPFSV